MLMVSSPLVTNPVMNPTPAKRARRTASPSSPSSQSQTSQRDHGPGGRNESLVSPTKPILPPPLPSAGHHGPSFPLPSMPSGRPQSWAPGWTSSGSTRSGPIYEPERDRERERERERGDDRGLASAGAGSSRVRSRQSFEAGSPSSPTSTQMESIDENRTTAQMVLTRDTTARAPRSIMACVRCRKQKMKCDGPGRIPCNGCRAAGLPCVFEPRTRPKSISTIPSPHHPPFFATRPATPTSVGVAGFYPPGAQPAPPAISRGPPGSGEYTRSAIRDIRDPREPMPPPPAASINVLTSPYPPAPRPSTPGSAAAANVASYRPAPATGLAPPYHIAVGPPLTQAPVRPPSPHIDSRLRSVETALHNFGNVPNSLTQINQSLAALHRSVDMLASSSSNSSSAPRAALEISDGIWEDYRSRAWPLTPWLIGLRDRHGLQGLVVDFLGKRVSLDRSDSARKAAEEAQRAVRSEIGKLTSQNVVWTKNEIRALGFFGTWTNDCALISLAMAQARLLGLDRIWDRRRSHDDWREWVYLAIMDHLSQLVDFEPPFTHDVLNASWRDRLGPSVPGTSESAARDRDRDLKLLAWLEYCETLAEVHRAQTDLLRSPENHDDTLGSDRQIVERSIEIWRKYSPRWEAWAGVWAVRNDPILSLYLNYAILYTTSPGCLAHESIWTELARDPEGYTLLERARDAGFAVIQSVCSPEIGRTLSYSFPLFRPILALAFHLVLTLTTLPSNIPPLVSVPHIQSVIRSTHDTLDNARPPEMLPGSGLLGEMAERGNISLAMGMGTWDMSRETWKRLIG
ncbi:hypothetical protein BD324DRAFT_332943 [Kockovaella imperatae]|uniref:Zn(2)-C6 fungal-type domain-containing protein n=1 Tax=Kockovaella imperatae TaxID=4999 RepID=A0A1Y1UPE5_9TREE|nr:hypothetical protein BD324DRAFT_332943 [Kockovaella imperatae]ORX39447.1 hypothetical protein BD324DRAFT_332943 [Kockovaella imperatae]